MDDWPVTAAATARRHREVLARCAEANARAAEAVKHAETALATARERLRRAQAMQEEILARLNDRADSARCDQRRQSLPHRTLTATLAVCAHAQSPITTR